jgi:hypothetical protein
MVNARPKITVDLLKAFVTGLHKPTIIDVARNKHADL